MGEYPLTNMRASVPAVRSRTSTIAVNINSTDFDFTMPVLPVGNYYFNFDDGLIFNNLGLTTNISDKETWKFSILAGQYNKTQYNNSQYFTD